MGGRWQGRPDTLACSHLGTCGVPIGGAVAHSVATSRRAACGRRCGLWSRIGAARASRAGSSARTGTTVEKSISKNRNYGCTCGSERTLADLHSWAPSLSATLLGSSGNGQLNRVRPLQGPVLEAGDEFDRTFSRVVGVVDGYSERNPLGWTAADTSVLVSRMKCDAAPA